MTVNNYFNGCACLARCVSCDIKRDGIVQAHLALVAVIVSHDYNRGAVVCVNAHHGCVDCIACHTRSNIFALNAQGVCAVRQLLGVAEHVGRVDAYIVAVLVCNSRCSKCTPFSIVENLGGYKNALLGADIVLKLVHRQALLASSYFKSGGG